VLLYSTVKFVVGWDNTSKLKTPALQVAFVRVSPPFDEAVVKVPPIYPPSGVPAGFCPLLTVQRINWLVGKAAIGVPVSTVLPAVHEDDDGSLW
jgi:hypothetical protein